jgi:flagellar motor switch protein FliN/FliY
MSETGSQTVTEQEVSPASDDSSLSQQAQPAPTGAESPQGAPAVSDSSSVGPDRVSKSEPAQSGSGQPVIAGMERIGNVAMTVTVELGRTTMAVKELLQLRVGSLVELDRAAGSPVDLLVNGKPIARGEVVVIDDDFGVRISEILPAEG